jgi:hypothetical protein
MTKRDTCRLAALVALLLAAGPAEASVLAKKVKVGGWLGAGDWQVRDEDDEAYLVKDPRRVSLEVSHTSWTVSKATIESSPRKLLAYDARGRDPNARLVKEAGKGDSTRWSFEKVSSIPLKRWSSDRNQVGSSGMTFRVRAVEGPYKGWYLATKDDEVGRRKSLVLVRHRKDATVFTYIEHYYYGRP